MDPYFEFVNSGDWALREGHYYTNKSPALSIMAIPAYALGEAIMRRIVPDDPGLQILGASYLATVSTVALSGALLCVLMLHVLHGFFGFSPGRSLALVLIFGTGTLFFPYSTALYCHSVSSFFCMLRPGDADAHQAQANESSSAAGRGCRAAASIAVLVRGLHHVPDALLHAVSAGIPARPAADHFFLAACVPAGLFQLYYNWVCFGGPFESSYAHANPAIMFYENGSLFGPANHAAAA